jgi:hypothetical protein
MVLIILTTYYLHFLTGMKTICSINKHSRTLCLIFITFDLIQSRPHRYSPTYTVTHWNPYKPKCFSKADPTPPHFPVKPCKRKTDTFLYEVCIKHYSQWCLWRGRPTST